MTNDYVLGKRSDTITIVSNKSASKVGKNQITLPPDLKIKYGSGKLVYWESLWLRKGYWTVILMPGQLYQHIFQIAHGKILVKITSKDQKRFNIEL